MSFNAQLPFLLRRRDDDDYDDNPQPTPTPSPSLRRELAKLALTTIVTAAVTKTVEHCYDRWKKRDEEKKS